jgi:hypothetical protein
MIKLLFLIVFFLMGPYQLKADEVPRGEQEFAEGLNIIKDPFEDGIPKPVSPVVQEPVIIHHQGPERPIMITPPKPKAAIAPVVTLPTLNLQGVIVGEDVYEAIIDDKVVPLSGTIDGAKVCSVSKKGVGLLYKGKKFFLKVE